MKKLYMRDRNFAYYIFCGLAASTLLMRFVRDVWNHFVKAEWWDIPVSAIAYFFVASLFATTLSYIFREATARRGVPETHRTTRNRWRFNKTFPYFVCSVLLAALCVQFVRALLFHITSSDWWGVLDTTIAFMLFGSIIVATIVYFSRRIDPPDCLPAYSFLGLFFVLTLFGLFSPVVRSLYGQTPVVAIRWLNPTLAVEMDRMEQMSRQLRADCDSCAVKSGATTAN